MANELRFDVESFADAIERASDDLRERILAIAIEEAGHLASRVREEYPQGPTGNLRRGVVFRQNTHGRGLGAYVRSNAPHVHFVESGHTAGPGRGNKRPSSQRVPKGTSVIFVPAAVAARQQFHVRVQAALDQPKVVG